MEVITNNILSKKFKSINEYKTDLGLAIKIDENTNQGEDYASGGKWEIKDKTIKKYYNLFGRFLSRTGKIGTLLFYVDFNLKPNEIFVIYENEVYYSEYNGVPIRSYLSDLIKNILDGNIEPYKEIKEERVEKVDLKNMSNEELAEYLAKNR